MNRCKTYRFEQYREGRSVPLFSMCVLRVHGKEPSKIQELTPVQEFITPKSSLQLSIRSSRKAIGLVCALANHELDRVRGPITLRCIHDKNTGA